MIRLAFRFVFFLVGVGVGIYVGVHYPTISGKISDAEAARTQAAVANAKIEILSAVISDQQNKPAASSALGAVSSLVGGGGAADTNTDKYKTMLAQSQQDLAAANSRLGK